MDRVQGPNKISIACDILFAWRRTIADGVTAQTSRTWEKYWKKWTEYCHECSTDEYLSDCTICEKSIILTGFAARVRTGTYGRGDQVKVQSVTDALSAISQTSKLVGQPRSPVYQAEGEYIIPVKRLVEGFRRQDPPAIPIPQMAVPLEIPEAALHLAYLSCDAKHNAVGDLIIIAFFFLLLRSGEYTKPRKG